MKNWKMAYKLGTGFGIITILVCTLGYLADRALSVSSNSINKMASAYLPASDAAASMLDHLRLTNYHIRLFDIYGESKDYAAAEQNLADMPGDFSKLQDVAARYADLTFVSAALREYPRLFAAYKDACAASAGHLNAIKDKNDIMLSSADTAESIMSDLANSITENRATLTSDGNLEAALRSGDNFRKVEEARILYKDFRRQYANARRTYDISAKSMLMSLGGQSLAHLEQLEQSLTTKAEKENCAKAITYLKNYMGEMAQLMQVWENLDSTAKTRAQATTQLVQLLENLNDVANKGLASYANAAMEDAAASITRMLSLTFVAVILAVVLWVFTTRSITVPLLRGMLFAEQVAQGNLDEELKVHSRDELGKLADALRSMVTSLKAKIEEARMQTEEARLSSLQALQSMEEAKKAQAAAENAKREGMLSAAGQLESIVEVVSSASSQLSEQVKESEHGAATTAERMSETATAMEEMNATVLAVARSASDAAKATGEARQKAELGAGIVSDVVSCISDVERQSAQLKDDMVQLGQQADAIGAIMNVISDIADQTNLLALNAAIEAARAGDAGRGFAVVADEVRKLAEKTMHATVEVGNAIKGVQDSAEKNRNSVDVSSQSIARANSLVQEAGGSLQEIVRMVEASADQVRTIATAAEQQSFTSEEINRALGSVNSASSDTAIAMHDAAKAVADLSQQSKKLSNLIEQMKRA